MQNKVILWHWWCMVLLGLSTTACPQRHTKAAKGAVSISTQGYFKLLPAASLGMSRQASQIFTSQVRGKKQVMYFQLEVEPGRIAMVGLTPLGVRLFSLLKRRQRVIYTPQPFFKVPLRPRHMLADFQLTFWPTDVLRQSLAGTGMTVKEASQQNHRLRRIVAGKRRIIEIWYQHPQNPWQGSIRFRHIERGYSFVVETKRSQVIPATNKPHAK